MDTKAAYRQMYSAFRKSLHAGRAKERLRSRLAAAQQLAETAGRDTARRVYVAAAEVMALRAECGANGRPA